MLKQLIWMELSNLPFHQNYRQTRGPACVQANTWRNWLVSHHVKNLSDLRDFVKTFPTRRQLWINAGKQTVVPGRLIPLLNLRDFFIDVILYDSPYISIAATVMRRTPVIRSCNMIYLRWHAWRPSFLTHALSQAILFFMLPPGSHMTVLYQLVGLVAILTCA